MDELREITARLLSLGYSPEAARYAVFFYLHKGMLDALLYRIRQEDAL